MQWMKTSQDPIYIIVLSWFGVWINIGFILPSTLDHDHSSSLMKK